jgi:outer membrane PBP1 activator LpoA protein
LKQYIKISYFKALCHRFYYLSLLVLLTGCEPRIDIHPALPAITATPKRVTLLLPLSGHWKEIGQAIEAGFKAAHAVSNAALEIKVLDTNRARAIQAIYAQGEANGSDLIIGPLLKTEVQTLAQYKNMKTPVLSLNYLEPNQTPPANFYQFGLSPIEEAKQAAMLAHRQGYSNALVIVPQSSWGRELDNAFTQQWEALGGTVIDRLKYKSHFSTLSYYIRTFLRFKPPQQRRTDFDVIFLGATSEFGRQINPLLAFYFAANVPIYSTSAIYDSALPSHLNRDLDPIVIGDAPWHLGMNKPYPHLKRMLTRHASQPFQHHARYYALGVDAFSVAMQLAQLDQDPTKTIEGATGNLRLNSDRYILRTMPFAKFKRGIPQLLPDSESFMQHATTHL